MFVVLTVRMQTIKSLSHYPPGGRGAKAGGSLNRPGAIVFTPLECIIPDCLLGVFLSPVGDIGPPARASFYASDAYKMK
jgi:hypothetical protein